MDLEGSAPQVLPETQLRIFRQKVQNVERRKQEKALKRGGTQQPPITDLTAHPFYTIPLLKGDTTNCPFCRNGKLMAKSKVSIVTYAGKNAIGSIVIVVPSCNKCGAPFATAEIWMEIFNQHRNHNFFVFDARLAMSKEHLLRVACFVTQDREKQQPPIPKLPRLPHELPEDYKENPPNLSNIPRHQYVWLYSTKCHCRSCQSRYGVNTMREITAVINTIGGRTVKVNVGYCVGCGHYYMDLGSYRAYNRRYGGILSEFNYIGKPNGGSGTVFDNFNPDSVLSRCGYNVRQETPIETRRAVLAYILSTKRALKYEVIELLNGFIGVHQYTHPEACHRWAEDLLFVNEFQIEMQPEVYGLTFRPGW